MSKIAQTLKAIAAQSPHNLKFIIKHRIVVRSIDGPYICGLTIDRTSTPDAYRVYAFTQSWLTAIDDYVLVYCVKLEGGGYFEGGGKVIAQDIEPYLTNDAEIRRIVFATPEDLFYYSRRAWSWDRRSHSTRVECAAIRALEGDSDGAMPELRALATSLLIEPIEPYWDRRRRMVADLIAAIERGIPVNTILDPIIAEAKASVRITAVRRPATAGNKPTDR